MSSTNTEKGRVGGVGHTGTVRRPRRQQRRNRAWLAGGAASVPPAGPRAGTSRRDVICQILGESAAGRAAGTRLSGEFIKLSDQKVCHGFHYNLLPKSNTIFAAVSGSTGKIFKVCGHKLIGASWRMSLLKRISPCRELD